MHEHAFAGDGCAAFFFCHLQKLCARWRVDDVADDLSLMERICRKRAFIDVRAHADGCRVDDDVEVCGNAYEIFEGRDLYILGREEAVQPFCKSFAFLSAAADDGELVALFHQRVGDGLGGSAVTEQGDFLAACVDAVFLEIPDAAVGVCRRSAEGAASDSVFPVERVDAACKAADGAELIDETRLLGR